MNVRSNNKRQRARKRKEPNGGTGGSNNEEDIDGGGGGDNGDSGGKRTDKKGFCAFRWKSVHTYPVLGGTSSTEMTATKDKKLRSFAEYIEAETEEWERVFRHMGCDRRLAADAIAAIERAIRSADPADHVETEHAAYHPPPTSAAAPATTVVAVADTTVAVAATVAAATAVGAATAVAAVQPTTVASANAGVISVFVKIPTGKTLCLDVKTTDMIWAIQQKVQDKEGVLTEPHMVLFEGCILGDNQTLAENTIVYSGATLHLVKQRRGS